MVLSLYTGKSLYTGNVMVLYRECDGLVSDGLVSDKPKATELGRILPDILTSP